MSKRFVLFMSAIALVLSSSTSDAQVNQVALDAYKQANPEARFYGTQFYDNEGFFEDIGTVNAIYGSILSTGATPHESAWNHVADLQDVYAQDYGTLIPIPAWDGQPVQGVMTDAATGQSRFSTFRFGQAVGGIPVFRSGIAFLVRNEPNFPVVLSGSNLKEMVNFELDANSVQNAAVTQAMKDNVETLFGDQPVLRSVLRRAKQLPLQVSDEALVIWAGVSNVQVDPELAMSFIATRGSTQTYPDYQKSLIIASVATGEILYSESMIHHVDVDGTVNGRATNGIGSLECHPEVPVGMPYAEVEVLGGNTSFADANGDFSIPHSGSSNVTVRSYLRGTFFEVFDESAGGSTPFIDLVVSPPGPANFTHNPTNGNETATANVNAYYESNRVRDYVLSYEPNYPVIANQASFNVNTNINSSCNAFYDGSSINFYTSGGGCNNTSFSDVVYHEYGHHLINVTGNGQGQMGEGSGDTVGVLMQDEPILGNGFQQNCNAGIRNADNNKQYPCSGGIHDCGQLMSGCVWSLRNELIVTEPSSYRDIGSSLFFGMLIVRGQMQPGNTTIDPFITILYLELDDDDGNIGNGTPHYAEIASAFGDHNMDAPPLDLVEFSYPEGQPELINPAGGVAFTVEVTGLEENPTPGTGVLYVDRGNGFEAFPMNEISTNVYEANFPTSECAKELRYYFSVDAPSGTQTDPSVAPDESFAAMSGVSMEVMFYDDAEASIGWTVSGDAVDGQWDRGVPVGGGDRGDPADDADGSGASYLTDNVDDNSDVDDGSTILTSPILDASVPSGKEAVVSYQRWYSNNFGNSPEADVFVVEVSDNGGSTWTTLETVGPTGAEVRGGWIKKSFRIRDFVTPTNQFRLRFNASDLGDGSVVEAAVDGIQIMHIGCETSVTADDVTVERGTIVGGGLADTFDSDDSDLEVERESGLNRAGPWSVIFDATLPNDSPSSLAVQLESRGSNIGLRQTVSMFNWNTGEFDEMDVRTLATTDSVNVIPVTGNLSDYVQSGTGAIRTRVRANPVITAVIRGPWTIAIDQITWTD